MYESALLSLSAFVLILSCMAAAQKREIATTGTDVLIVGTFHSNQHDFEKYPQDLEQLMGRIMKFRPEAI
jgi:hypothetical protein